MTCRGEVFATFRAVVEDFCQPCKFFQKAMSF